MLHVFLFQQLQCLATRVGKHYVCSRMCTIEFLTKLSYKQLPFAGCEIALFGFKEEDQLDVVEQAEKNGKYLLHTVVWEKFTVG